tara:strand:+ start:134 stop:685 length:552 start_codon:yes stop_codon:yes gene_type:complete
MKIKEIKKQIKGIFKQPEKRYYFGKAQFGCPYMFPTNYNSTVFSFRKLKLTPQDDYEKIILDKPWLKDRSKFINRPISRCKNWVFKLFGNYYWLEVGSPISIRNVDLGWKDKYETPRHEWDPQFHIYFFGLQFSCWQGMGVRYWEQVLWFLKYSDKDIKKAEETWPWGDGKTKLTTWDKNYLI